MATLKLGIVGDPHYAPADVPIGPGFTSYRSRVLTWLDRFNARMETFAPDGVVAMGDNTTATGASDKTSLLTDLVAKIAEATAPHTVIVGNHDFEYATPAEVRAVLAASQTYLEAGTLYGSFDLGDFHIVVLDPMYVETTPFAHTTQNGGYGHGYIPDGTDGSDDELGWLTADLAATTKRTIVFCHVTLDEFDGSTFYHSPTSDFDRFSVVNRATVRAVLEASGKVIAVVHGHQHFFRTDNIKGIPYIHAPSFCDEVPYPGRLISDSDRGRWVELSVDTASAEITAELYEDHSTRGAELAARQRVRYTAFNEDGDANPYRLYAFDYAAGIGSASTGAPSYDGGDLTQWTVVTDTTGYAPVDMVLAQARVDEPFGTNGGLVLKGGSTAKAGTATRRMAPQSGTFVARMTLRRAETNKRLNFKLMSPAGVAGPSIALDASGNIVTAAGVVLGTYAADTDYDIEIAGDTATDRYGVAVNGSAIGSHILFATALSSIDRVQFEWPAGQNGTAYLDALYLALESTTTTTTTSTTTSTSTTTTTEAPTTTTTTAAPPVPPVISIQGVHVAPTANGAMRVATDTRGVQCLQCGDVSDATVIRVATSAGRKGVS